MYQVGFIAPVEDVENVESFARLLHVLIVLQMYLQAWRYVVNLQDRHLTHYTINIDNIFLVIWSTI